MKSDCTTADVVHSPKLSNKEFVGKQSSIITKETVPALKDDHLPTTVHKRLKQKVHIKQFCYGISM